MTLEELKKIDATVGERTGWDFSVMKTERDPISWQYVELVKQYLKPSDYVLDLGTGGGEIFLKLADSFKKGIGIDRDPDMIKTAKEKTPQELKEKISFEVMDTNELTFSDSTFDAVIDRQAPVHVDEIVRILKTDGYFITQMIGKDNMQNINQEFNPNFVSKSKLKGDVRSLAERFSKKGCFVIAVCSYNVNYYVKDVASLLFWFKAIRSHGHAMSAIPEDFMVEKYWPQIDSILTKYKTPKGYVTNEHRELLIIRKGRNVRAGKI